MKKIDMCALYTVNLECDLFKNYNTNYYNQPRFNSHNQLFNSIDCLDEIASFFKDVYFEKLKDKGRDFTFQESLNLKSVVGKWNYICRNFENFDRQRSYQYFCFKNIKNFKKTKDRFSDKFTFKTRENGLSFYFCYSDARIYTNSLADIESIKKDILLLVEKTF